MARPNKKQHKTPRTYLEAFANPDGRVWVWDGRLRIYTEKPINILTEKDFYTVRFPGGGGTLTVETEYLGGIETAYGDIYREKISQQKPLDPPERAAMAIFIASMLERSPRRREAIKGGFDQVRQIVETMRASVAAMTPAEKKAFEARQPYISEQDRENSIPADEFLEAGQDVPSLHSAGIPDGVAAVAPIIFDMNWAFMVRPDGAEPFITSDSPCTIDNPSLPPRSVHSSDLTFKDVEVSMSLSPNLAIICGWKLKTDGEYILVKPESVADINRRIMRHSNTVVSNDKAMLERQSERVKNIPDNAVK